jgi:sucrose-6-phosphate hydrolase SacC (GH32 family)
MAPSTPKSSALKKPAAAAKNKSPKEKAVGKSHGSKSNGARAAKSSKRASTKYSQRASGVSVKKEASKVCKVCSKSPIAKTELKKENQEMFITPPAKKRSRVLCSPSPVEKFSDGELSNDSIHSYFSDDFNDSCLAETDHGKKKT